MSADLLEVDVQDQEEDSFDSSAFDFNPEQFSQEFVDDLVAKCLVFTEELSGITFFPYQRQFAARMIESILIGDGATLTFLCSRQSGKTQSVANTLAALMILLPRLAKVFPDLLGKFSRGFWVGVFAPTEDQVETMYGRIVDCLTSEEAVEILMDPEVDDKTEAKGAVLKLKKSGSLVRMRTANPKAKVESKTYHVIIGDETQEIDEFMWDKCFAEGTPIWLPDGRVVPVEQVVSERLDVLSYDSEAWTRIPSKPTPGRPPIHDWTVLFDGEEHKISIADFNCSNTDQLRSRAYSAAKSQGGKITSRKIDAETLAVTYHGPSPRKTPVSPLRDPGNLVGTTPTEWHVNGTKDVYKVVMSSGRELSVTAEHRWPVRRQEGTRQLRMLETKDLLVGDRVPIPDGVDFWGETGTEEEGYFLGSMLGDGCMSSNTPMWCGFKNGAYFRMQKFAESLGASLRVYQTASSGLLNFTVSSGMRGNVENPVTRFLRDHQVWGAKGEHKRLQRQDYSREFLVGVVSGLIDTDGCVYVPDKGAGTVSFNNTSEELVRQVSDVFLKLGVYSVVSCQESNTEFGFTKLWSVSVRDAKSVVRLSEVLNLADETKSAKLQKFASKSRGKVSRRTCSGISSYPERMSFDRIVSITHAGKKKTYCVTVEPSHVLVANGLVVGQSISPMISFWNGTQIMTGTPTTHKGLFFKQIQRNKREQTKRGARQNHFEFDWKHCARANPNYGRFVKSEMLRIGEDSDRFQMSYCLRWVLDRGMFTTSARLDELGDRSMQLVKTWYRTPVVVGVDPARKMDSTVVTVCYVDWEHPDALGFYDHRVLNWLEIQGEDWEEQYYLIQRFLSNYSVLQAGVDSQGVGDAVAQRLAVLMPYTDVIPVPSDPASQTKRWLHLQQLMDRGRIGWPAHAKTRRLRSYKRFYQQMEDLEKVYKGKYLTAAAPNVNSAHDDYPDSLAIATSLTQGFTMPEVEVSDNPFYGR